jgi:hypothetical protein
MASTHVAVPNEHSDQACPSSTRKAIETLFMVSSIMTGVLLIWLNTVQHTTQFNWTWNWENALSSGNQFYLSITWAVLTLSFFLAICLRKKVNLLATGILLLVACENFGVSIGFQFEPSQLRIIVSAAMFMLLLSLLDYAFDGWHHRWHLRERDTDSGASVQQILGYQSTRLRSLWYCVPLFFVWSLLSTSFSVGLFVLLIYFAFRTVEAYYRCGSAAHGLVRRFAMMLTVATLATLILPFNWYQLFDQVTASKALSDVTIQSVFGPFTIGFWMLFAVILVATFASRQQKDFTHSVTCIVLFAVSYLVLENFAFVALACCVWLSPHMHSALLRLQEMPTARIWSSSIQIQRTICVGLLCANLCLSFFIFQTLFTSTQQISSLFDPQSKRATFTTGLGYPYQGK